MTQRHLITRFLTGLFAVGTLAAVLVPGVVVQAAETPIIIWADAARAPTLQAELAGGFRGRPITLVTKDLAAIRADLKTVAAPDAPDIVWAEHSWTGELAQAGLIVPIPMAKALRDTLRPSALQGFRTNSQIFGLPVQSENVALITNGELVPKPVGSFADLAKKALRLKKNGKVDVPLAVAQGPTGNAYFMQPLFAGLGGYVFGQDAEGNLVPSDLGVDNKTFRKNAKLIDSWNAAGLVNSSVDVNAARNAFLTGRAPFWITGQWNTNDLKGLKFKYFVSTVPNIVPGLQTSPFLGIKGFMLTKYAAEHGVQADALGLIRKELSKPGLQGKIAALSGRVPASLAAPMDRLAQAFAVAGAQGVPTPNIPQETAVWSPLGAAWAASTKGDGATPAKQAFAQAQAQIASALG